MVCDDVTSLRSGLHTNFMRGALNVGHDGRIAWWMHPWRTLQSVFGEEAAMTLSWWLLKQVHEQFVKDYLSIQHYYLDRTDVQPAPPEAAARPTQALRPGSGLRLQGRPPECRCRGGSATRPE